jgi:hypothetical protein
MQYLTGSGLKASYSEIAGRDVLPGEGPRIMLFRLNRLDNIFLHQAQWLLGLASPILRMVNMLPSSGIHLHVLLVPFSVSFIRNPLFLDGHINTYCNKLYT